jgi:hypothetical protein
MTNPKFSAITDLYSISQLQRALVEAADIAQAARGLAGHLGYPEGHLDAIDSALAALIGAADDARKVSNG